MPIYDYKCLECEKEFEYFHATTDDKEAVCPHCGAKKAEKQVSKNTSFQLNGKGWYKDGY